MLYNTYDIVILSQYNVGSIAIVGKYCDSMRYLLQCSNTLVEHDSNHCIYYYDK